MKKVQLFWKKLSTNFHSEVKKKILVAEFALLERGEGKCVCVCVLVGIGEPGSGGEER